jgi:hypothetical protein
MKSEHVKILYTGVLKPIRAKISNYQIEEEVGSYFPPYLEYVYSASIKVYATMSVPNRLDKAEVMTLIAPQLETQLRRELYKDMYNWVHEMYNVIYDPESDLGYEERDTLLTKLDELQNIMEGK